MSRLTIDGDRCQGHGRCYDLSPALFDCADDNGHAQVIDASPGGDDVEAAERAVRECPERAIHLEM